MLSQHQATCEDVKEDGEDWVDSEGTALSMENSTCLMDDSCFGMSSVCIHNCLVDLKYPDSALARICSQAGAVTVARSTKMNNGVGILTTLIIAMVDGTQTLLVALAEMVRLACIY